MDEDALLLIVWTYGYAMAITRNRTDAEDLVQETYLRAIPRMGSLRPESNLKSWLFTILRNIHLNQLRKQRLAPKVLEIDADENTANIVVETSKDPLAQYVSMAERDCVLQAIQQSPSVFRQIVVLREYEDLLIRKLPVFWTALSVQSCPAWQEPVPNCGFCFRPRDWSARKEAIVSLSPTPGSSVIPKSQNERVGTFCRILRNIFRRRVLHRVGPCLM